MNQGEQPAQGAYIQAGQTAGGFRDFLLGEPIHAGSTLEVLLGGRWISGRYECDYHSGDAWLYLSDAVVPINRTEMHFRWPSRD